MAKIIRVYPRTGAYGAMGNMNAFQTQILKAQAQTALTKQALNFEKQLGNFKLGALGKIYESKLENVELKARIKYSPQMQMPGYGYPQYPGYPIGGYPQPVYGAVHGASGLGMFGGLGGMFGGLGLGMF